MKCFTFKASFDIYVDIYEGERYTLADVSSKTKIKSIKLMIEQLMGAPVNRQTLSFSFHELEKKKKIRVLRNKEWR